MMPPIDLGYDFLCFLYTLIVWYIILLYKRLWLRDHGYNVSLKELWHSLQITRHLCLPCYYIGDGIHTLFAFSHLFQLDDSNQNLYFTIVFQNGIYSHFSLSMWIFKWVISHLLLVYDLFKKYITLDSWIEADYNLFLVCPLITVYLFRLSHP